MCVIEIKQWLLVMQRVGTNLNKLRIFFSLSSRRFHRIEKRYTNFERSIYECAMCARGPIDVSIHRTKGIYCRLIYRKLSLKLILLWLCGAQPLYFQFRIRDRLGQSGTALNHMNNSNKWPNNVRCAYARSSSSAYKLWLTRNWKSLVSRSTFEQCVDARTHVRMRNR